MLFWILCLLRFLCLPDKEKRVFCGASWLAMKNGFILIIPNGENREWIPTNAASMPKRNIHGHKTLLCILWNKRVCCITNSCVEIKPLQLIAPNSNYADWVTNWCKKYHPSINIKPTIDAKSFCCMITLDCVLQKARSKHLQFEWEILSHPAYSQTWHNQISISSDRYNMHLRTHSSPVMKKSKNE